eukprot:1392634-Prymnesium_polylepis.3
MPIGSDAPGRVPAPLVPLRPFGSIFGDDNPRLSERARAARHRTLRQPRAHHGGWLINGRPHRVPWVPEQRVGAVDGRAQSAELHICAGGPRVLVRTRG